MESQTPQEGDVAEAPAETQTQSEQAATPVPGKVKIIDNIWTFVVAFLFVGPLALPLLWRNPTISRRVKIAGTVGALIFTAALMALTGGLSQRIYQQYQDAQHQIEIQGQ